MDGAEDSSQAITLLYVHGCGSSDLHRKEWESAPGTKSAIIHLEGELYTICMKHYAFIWTQKRVSAVASTAISMFLPQLYDSASSNHHPKRESPIPLV